MKDAVSRKSLANEEFLVDIASGVAELQILVEINTIVVVGVEGVGIVIGPHSLLIDI